ncbi:MAG: histidinol-phosphate transaminase [Candidatus Binatia bacterium]|nr:histidinol-phosphate transaminase [Candidatus Binatia bacterium]
MKLPWIREAVRQLHPYVPGEQPQERGFIKLNTNENPYPPSPRVLEAIRTAANEDLRLYPDPSARAVREVAAERYGVSPEQILVGNGSDELLSLVVRACVDHGDVVAYPHPTYSLYDTLVQIQTGRIQRVPYGKDFCLPDGLEEMRPKLVFICHPNSPSGTAVEIDRIRALASRLPATLVVVDEAYVDFASASALPLIQELPNIVVLRTLSKSFSLAGLRIGLAVGRSQMIAELGKLKDSYNVDRLAIVGARAALEDYAWMQENVRRIRSTRERLIAALRSLGFEVPQSEANFVLARRRGERLDPLYRALRERRILVRYFDTPELEDALRITVGTDTEVDALVAALKEIESV